MRALKIVEPEDLYAYAKQEGLLANPGEPAPCVSEQVLPPVDVAGREGRICELAEATGRRTTSFELRFDEAQVWGGPLAIIHREHLLAGGFCHQQIWATDAHGHSNLDGTLQLPDLPQVDVPVQRPQIVGHCSHWGHFFTDTLDRLLALVDSGEAEAPLLADGKPVCPNALDLLFHAGLLTRPLDFRHLKGAVLYRARDLRMHTLTSRKPSAPVDSFRRVRQAIFARHSRPGDVVQRALFVGRSQVTLRKLANQSELAASLEASGWASMFYPELHPIAETVRVFSSHDTIVMPLGSAKFNLIFCRPGTRVVCIAPKGYAESNGSVCQLLRHMCVALELDLSFYSCASVPGEGKRAHMLLHHDLNIEVADVEVMLSTP